MSNKTREVIWDGRMMGADMRAPKRPAKRLGRSARAADRAEAEARGVVGPHGRLWRASAAKPNIGKCLNGGYCWLEIECRRCKTRASLPLDAIRRARDTPIWKLESSFRCRSCGIRRYKPPVRMIKLTEQREITPYKWVHPDEER